MDDESRKTSVYRDSAAPSSSSARAELAPLGTETDTNVRRVLLNDRLDWRDPERRVLLDERTFRDHFADRRVERRDGDHPYPPLEPSSHRLARQEYPAELPGQGPSGRTQYDVTSRPIYRSTQYVYPDQLRGPSEDQASYYGHMHERPLYPTSSYSYPGDSENDAAQRERPLPFQRHAQGSMAPSQLPDHLYREQAMRSDDLLHRDKRARVDPYFDRPRYGPTDELHPPSLHASSQYRSVSKSVERSDHADVRRAPSRSSMNDSWQRDAVNAQNLRQQRSYSSSSFSQDGAPESVGDMSADRMATSSRSNTVKRRKRAVLSCTECKQRKIKCDRNVPNCSSCVRRGVAHLCRWGDERDFVTATQTSNVTPSNAALMARIAQLETHVRVLQSAAPSAASDPQASAAAGKRWIERARVGASYDAVSSQSSGHDARSDAEDPPNFTSRERSTKGRRPKHDIRSSNMARSETSEQTDSTGGEMAQNVLRSMDKATSLKAIQDGLLQEDNDRMTDSFKFKHADVPEQGSRQQGSDVDSTKQSVDGRKRKEATASQSPRLFVLGTVTGLFEDWDIQKIHVEMINILGLLPTREKTEAMIHFYLREAEPIINSIHLPSFLDQLERFWLEYGQSQRGEKIEDTLVIPDLQFAALLLATVEGACEYLTPAEILASGICSSRATISTQLARLSRSCLSLLGMDQFIRRPRIWGLQAVIALRHFCFNRGCTEEYLVLLQMAMKGAENIGLHRLGSALKDEERWADYDEAHQPGDIDISTVQGDASMPSVVQRKAIQRWRALVSAKIEADSDSDSESDSSSYIRQDLNSMWLPRGSQRTQWELKAAKRYADRSRVKRETGRKVWFALVTLDWQCAAHFDCCYHGSDYMFTTQSPQNIDDVDIIDTIYSDSGDKQSVLKKQSKTKALSFMDKIREHAVPTINSFVPIHIEICHTVRSIADALNRGDDSLDTVATIEARFRNTLSSLPLFFRLDGESEYDLRIHQLHRDRPYLSFQRAVIHEHVHQRLLKLHRLLMSRGYRNTKYIHSTRTCIEGARVVIAILSSLDQVGCRGHKCWIFKTHIFHAVLALQVDLLYLARQPVDQEIEAKRADVIAGLKMLHARTDMDGKNPILASSLKVIKALREEELSRRSRDATSADGSGVSSSEDRHGSQSPQSGRKTKQREWTRASESTGELAEHLGRRIQETWSTVDPALLRRRLPSTDSTITFDQRQRRSSSTADSRLVGNPAGLETPSTDDSTARPTGMQGDAQNQPTIETTNHPVQDVDMHTDRRDADLDAYLELLTSYQNPHKTPGGSKVFNVLDDTVFENAAATKLTFGAPTTIAADTNLSVPKSWSNNSGMLRGDNDLAAAGAGFDGFTTA